MEIIERKRSRTVLTPNGAFDEYRKLERFIKIFGKEFRTKTVILNCTYSQAVFPQKPIGFVKPDNNEETNKEKQDSDET
jgi:hypothetical protein